MTLYVCGEEKPRITTNNISILNWDQIIKAKKGVRARDKMLCGNVIAEYNENIIIIHGEFVCHEHMIPKSTVEYYDGKEIHLNIPYSMLSRFDF